MSRWSAMHSLLATTKSANRTTIGILVMDIIQVMLVLLLLITIDLAIMQLLRIKHKLVILTTIAMMVWVDLLRRASLAIPMRSTRNIENSRSKSLKLRQLLFLNKSSKWDTYHWERITLRTQRKRSC